MKIAFLISAGRFPSGILQELRAQLPQHQPATPNRHEFVVQKSTNQLHSGAAVASMIDSHASPLALSILIDEALHQPLPSRTGRGLVNVDDL
jgi:hypothetical protein